MPLPEFGSEHPVYGTTIYIGRNQIDTVYGPFEVYTFQDLITKGYVLALVHGDPAVEKVVYTRLHSSCVTSETLGSLDCDCVQQLHGALEVIKRKPCGILFYLIQEGRGCGYVGKSRACMLVQYHNDTISTFDAYRELGMKKDYRTYQSISDICHILRISPEFVLLTNNPDKIEGLQGAGMTVKGVESIEVPPNPFNQPYLTSKQQSGHLLVLAKNKVPSFQLPHPPNKPFTPRAVDAANRFVHVSSYYLPVKPRRILMTAAEYDEMQLNLPFELTADGEYLVLIEDNTLIEQNAHLLRRPFWFQVHVYYDIVTQTEFVCLEYGDCRAPKRPPYVRIHSESIFSRFPLRSTSYKDKFRESVYQIVRNGVGMIILFYHDGRGYGLGHYVINAQREGDTPREADTRDFAGAADLLSHHVAGPYVMLYSGMQSKALYSRHFGNILDWVWIGDTADSHGLQLMAARNERIFERLDAANHSISCTKPFVAEGSYLVTGVGSSEAHAKFFVANVPPPARAAFFPIGTPLAAVDPAAKIVVFSQGMSPHTQAWISRAHVVFTAVSENSKDTHKLALLRGVLERGGTVVNFPEEDEYTVLMRVIGPFFGFVAARRFLNPQAPIPRAIELKKLRYAMPSLAFSLAAIETRRLAIVLPHAIVPYSQNLGYKWIEGLYFSPPFVSDYLSWIHGSFQAISGSAQVTPHILVTTAPEGGDDDPNQPVATVLELLGNRHPTWIIRARSAEPILELEVLLNYWILGLMNRVHTNQKEWPGKHAQAKLYDTVATI